ncbi:MAG: hypothetical protein IT366_09690 [Candidatus Hydrogenedentes bacterium]|nr:hypothetical protein [Candidatus Hydrogenedentota bacterium]
MAIDFASFTREDIRRLDVTTRRRLLIEIGRSLADEESAFELTDEQEEELAIRLAEDDANPDEGEDWRAAMEDIRKKWLNE